MLTRPYLRQLDQLWRLEEAGAAPGGPEITTSGFPLNCARDVPPVHVLQRQGIVRGWRPQIRDQICAADDDRRQDGPGPEPSEQPLLLHPPYFRTADGTMSARIAA
jgi:hypothetical protein